MGKISAHLITDTADLKTFCAALKNEEYIAVDTEFLRERTYYAELCLIQVAGERDAAAIDVLADDIDLTCLWKLLQSKNILKVFHAGKQDIEILLQLTGKMPLPFFDTQVAAMLTGFGEQVGYESLVRQLTGHQLDKGQQYTDWSRRPLSKAQLEYAVGDVTYLRSVYEELVHRLDKVGRLDWMIEEMKTLSDISSYKTDTATAWERIKRRDKKPHYLARVKALGTYREEMAQKLDLPRGWVIHDDVLQELALYNPKSPEAVEKKLSQMRRRGAADSHDIFDLLQEASNLDVKDCPPKESKRPLSPLLEPARDLMKVLLRAQAVQHEIASSMIASTDDLSEIVQGNRDLPCFSGWRHEVFGAVAERLIKGELCISLDEKFSVEVAEKK